MALAVSNVGRTWGPVVGVLDARQTMAYAAGIGDDAASYFDTNLQRLPVHPLYPVSPEWSLLITDVAADEPWSRADALFGVHATHDLTLHRKLHAGMEFSLTATVVSLEQRRPGAYQVIRFNARDAKGRTLWTSWTGTLFRGVAIDGQPTAIDGPEPVNTAHGDPLIKCGRFVVTLTDAHIYSECARIWNPIHTDISIARKAGLDGVILHGTATLAKSVTQLSNWLGIDPTEVRRIACRFASPARPGDVLSVRAYQPQMSKIGTSIGFDVTDKGGRTIVRDGLLELDRFLPD
jgi:acyl dehydratase